MPTSGDAEVAAELLALERDDAEHRDLEQCEVRPARTRCFGGESLERLC